MSSPFSLGHSRDYTIETRELLGNKKVVKKLFTPGPLGVSVATKEAMLQDIGSREKEFTDTVKLIRQLLLDLANVSPEEFTTVILQGSGTYMLEAVLQSATPRDSGQVLVLVNGAYGLRIEKICERVGLPYESIPFPEGEKVDPQQLELILRNKKQQFSTVVVIHCETSTGVINPVKEIGLIVRKYCPGAAYIVDGMSSFGAIPLDFQDSQVDYLISSANKCLEGVPGFSFCIARLEHFRKCKGNARSLSFDLYDQFEEMERTGQFRFTPPTHALLAFHHALMELVEEGGMKARGRRYHANCEIIREGMKKLGFKKLVPDAEEYDGFIITSFLNPSDPNFTFDEFYQRLLFLGQVIYTGKVTQKDTFRIGNIGHLYPEDMNYLLNCIECVLKDMHVAIPVSY
ncbi:uncharacterized protein LOC106457627 [Limulus polyphemus]|uniref:Alanine--glyoxylate aminotransferase n=1 Tax=Limulus polyphemus TaxID=6850 RepID=A0ABM1S6T2_LIMPO|nr:uncharacterized protein LOC106457627 [Limulus polyphemus]